MPYIQKLDFLGVNKTRKLNFWLIFWLPILRTLSLFRPHPPLLEFFYLVITRDALTWGTWLSTLKQFRCIKASKKRRVYKKPTSWPESNPRLKFELSKHAVDHCAITALATHWPMYDEAISAQNFSCSDSTSNHLMTLWSVSRFSCLDDRTKQHGRDGWSGSWFSRRFIYTLNFFLEYSSTSSEAEALCCVQILNVLSHIAVRPSSFAVILPFKWLTWAENWLRAIGW